MTERTILSVRVDPQTRELVLLVAAKDEGREGVSGRTLQLQTASLPRVLWPGAGIRLDPYKSEAMLGP
jgi:hypothetical protein